MFSYNHHSENEHFKKWMAYYQVHLKKMYTELMSMIALSNLPLKSNTTYNYALFCTMIYKNSSKRIPKY